MLWHGGASYAPGKIPADLEPFDSLADAVRAFDARADSWETYYPCVEREPAEEGGQSAWIFFYDPANDPGDPCPDRIIEYGPRGDIHVRHPRVGPA
jgi:hypothetical protein